MSNLQYNVANSKPLIPRSQNYVLDRKLLTVHAEDRDVNKWPNSNHFEIMLPEALYNVQSLRLTEFILPMNLYTFSNQNQNTKLQFTLEGTVYCIEIEPGFYIPCQLAYELTNKMNQAVGSSYTEFNVFYNSVSQKLWFGNSQAEFTLNFDQYLCYTDQTCDQPNNVWGFYTKWGLPSYLGFEKAEYVAQGGIPTPTFDYLGLPPDNLWVNPLASNNPITYYVTAPLTVKITGDNCIYMMVDKYNSYDELYPYSQTTTATFNNDYGGKVNSAFAKIPISREQYGGILSDAKTLFLQNLYQYEPPIERISKFKFKFRYHDGRLVDFQDIPFDFTVEINSIRNEFNAQYTVRVPALYANG